ncbi:MAG TPA: glycosyltransferase, partial [Gemmatimonadales bacterium]
TRGVAVVASAWGAAPEVVHGGGILVDPRDPAAFRDAVAELLRDSGRGARAREDAGRFNWEAAADATLAIYHRLRS